MRSITLNHLLCSGEPPLTTEKLLDSARYAYAELPIRLARRIQAFQRLPFIVGTNPYVHGVHGTYYQSFQTLRDQKSIENLQDDTELTQKLVEMTERHRENIPKIARGFLNLLITTRIPGMQAIFT